ncbi:MAG: cell division protein SepF [Candidatus Pacearchaeota archaeon]|nr:cell division protein SepF [Candidatus Pacearchaeota archaeon]
MVFKKLFGGSEKAPSPDYIEVDVGKEEAKKTKIVVRPFILNTFEDVNRVLEVLREGYTIALIDIKPLKQKDIVELKRAISKLKKTVDALEGNIAGFGENTIVATPSFVEVYKGEKNSVPKTELPA